MCIRDSSLSLPLSPSLTLPPSLFVPRFHPPLVAVASPTSHALAQPRTRISKTNALASNKRALARYKLL
eukprot:973557-Rhodomonas_salina.1